MEEFSFFAQHSDEEKKCRLMLNQRRSLFYTFMTAAWVWVTSCFVFLLKTLNQDISWHTRFHHTKNKTPLPDSRDQEKTVEALKEELGAS